MFGVYELVAQRAAALALVEPVGQQDEPVPAVLQAAYVVRQSRRLDGRPHLHGLHIQVRDLVTSQWPLSIAVPDIKEITAYKYL